jgi:hypothetical protein
MATATDIEWRINRELLALGWRYEAVPQVERATLRRAEKEIDRAHDKAKAGNWEAAKIHLIAAVQIAGAPMRRAVQRERGDAVATEPSSSEPWGSAERVYRREPDPVRVEDEDPPPEIVEHFRRHGFEIRAYQTEWRETGQRTYATLRLCLREIREGAK